MTGCATHDDDEVPASRAAGIFHDVMDEFEAQLSSSLEAEGGNFSGQREIVVDGFRNMTDTDPTGCLFGTLARRKHRVTSTNRRQVTDAEAIQGFNNTFQVFRFFGRVRA